MSPGGGAVGAVGPPRSLLAHMGVPGPAPFVAMALFLAGMAAVAGAAKLGSSPARPARRAGGIALGALAAGCLGLATAVPFLFHVPPSRPASTARLVILSPRPGEVFRGSPAVVEVELRVVGGRVTPRTSLHLLPNVGHIHLYVDGRLVAMTGLRAQVPVPPGRHVLRAEFVALDHGPFRPRVLAQVGFEVTGGAT